MSEFVPVAKLAALKQETGHTVEVKGRLIALFLKDGVVHAMDDICPHMGASLGSGSVHDGIVICPWHGWRFRVTDGKWADAPKSGTAVPCYEVKVAGDDILLNVHW